jgi:hypothetical protein
MQDFNFTVFGLDGCDSRVRLALFHVKQNHSNPADNRERAKKRLYNLASGARFSH